MLINVIVVIAVLSGVPVVASFGLTIARSELHNNVGEFGGRNKTTDQAINSVGEE